MSKRYSQEVHEFIKANVEGRTTKELVKLVNSECGTEFTESQMKSYKTNHKLKSGTPVGLPKGHASSIFPQPVVDYIRTNYKGIGNKEMAERLNSEFGTTYTRSQIKGYYGNHHLNSGLDGRYKKGHIPINKGKKGYHFPGSEKGWFTKGHMPNNHKPIGSERVDADGYTLVKTAEPNVWMPKHKLIWEKRYGKVPEGYIITFLDGDKSNISIENLALITMAESLELTRSNLRSSNPEFTKTGILIAKVKNAGNKKHKKIKRSNRNAAVH